MTITRILWYWIKNNSIEILDFDLDYLVNLIEDIQICNATSKKGLIT